MAIQKKVNLLDPAIRGRVVNFLAKLDDLRIKYVVVETKRSLEVQEAYYAQGRKSIEEVNDLRRVAGLWEITKKDNEKTVTNTLKSKHLDGLAVDIAPMVNGRVWWNAPEEVWLEIGVIGESFGLSWGGRWGQTAAKLGWDCPHFQL